MFFDEKATFYSIRKLLFGARATVSYFCLLMNLRVSFLNIKFLNKSAGCIIYHIPYIVYHRSYHVSYLIYHISYITYHIYIAQVVGGEPGKGGTSLSAMIDGGQPWRRSIIVNHSQSLFIVNPGAGQFTFKLNFLIKHWRRSYHSQS